MKPNLFRSIIHFLFIEILGYRRPSSLTEADHEARRRQAAQTDRLEREIAVLDATRDNLRRRSTW